MRKFAAGAAGIATVLVAYYVLTWRSVSGLLASFDACSELLCDFAIYYFPMGEAIFRTGRPVEGFLYSPFIGILLAAFPPLGLEAALVAWGILQVVAVVLYLLVFRRLVPAGLPTHLLFAALVLSSYPVLFNFAYGQVSVFMMVPLLGMLVLAGSGHRATAAFLLALAVSVKFYPILVVAPFVARRDHRLVLFSVAACGVILFGVPGLVLGGADTLGFYGALLESFRDSAWVVANPHSNYLPHAMLRLAGAMGHDLRAHLPLLVWIGYGLAVANMGLIFLIERARLRDADLWGFQICLLTTPLVLKTSWPHDFVFLPLTQALLAWRLLRRKEAATSTGAWKDRIGHPREAVTWLSLLVSIGLSSIVFFNLFGDFTGYGFWGFLLWSDLLLLAALYVQLLAPALRRGED